MGNDAESMKEAGLRAGARLYGAGYLERKGEEFAEIGSNFWDFTIEYVYGGFYDRGVLDERTRELCAIACLTAVGVEPQLEAHIKAAFRMGIDAKEVLEPIIQACVYCGYPATMKAINIYRRCLSEMHDC